MWRSGRQRTRSTLTSPTSRSGFPGPSGRSRRRPRSTCCKYSATQPTQEVAQGSSLINTQPYPQSSNAQDSSFSQPKCPTSSCHSTSTAPSSRRSGRPTVCTRGHPWGLCARCPEFHQGQLQDQAVQQHCLQTQQARLQEEVPLGKGIFGNRLGDVWQQYTCTAVTVPVREAKNCLSAIPVTHPSLGF